MSTGKGVHDRCPPGKCKSNHDEMKPPTRRKSVVSKTDNHRVGKDTDSGACW